MKNRRKMSITNAQKARKRGLKKVFNSLTLQTYQTYIQEAFKVFEWLSMTFLASFLKTETLVMENYCPSARRLKSSQVKIFPVGWLQNMNPQNSMGVPQNKQIFRPKNWTSLQEAALQHSRRGTMSQHP